MDKQNSFGQQACGFVKESFRILGKYFLSRLLISFMLGIICYIILWILGINLKLLLSIIVAVTTLVPLIGPIVAMIVCALIVVFQSPMYALWVTIINLGLQILDAWILSPLILGKSLGVSPLVVIVAVIVGGSMFGILGLILAAPAAAIIGLFIKIIRKNKPNK